MEWQKSFCLDILSDLALSAAEFYWIPFFWAWLGWLLCIMLFYLNWRPWFTGNWGFWTEGALRGANCPHPQRARIQPGKDVAEYVILISLVFRANKSCILLDSHYSDISVPIQQLLEMKISIASSISIACTYNLNVCHWRPKITLSRSWNSMNQRSQKFNDLELSPSLLDRKKLKRHSRIDKVLTVKSSSLKGWKSKIIISNDGDLNILKKPCLNCLTSQINNRIM